MKILSRIILSVALAAPLAVTTAAQADDKTSSSGPRRDLTVDQLPAAVKSTVQREVKNKNIQSIMKSTDANGAIVYEIVYLDGDKENSLQVAANGKVMTKQVRATDPAKSSNQPNQNRQSPDQPSPSQPSPDQPSQNQPSQNQPNPTPTPSRHGSEPDHSDHTNHPNPPAQPKQ